LKIKKPTKVGLFISNLNANYLAAGAASAGAAAGAASAGAAAGAASAGAAAGAASAGAAAGASAAFSPQAVRARANNAASKSERVMFNP
jgi:hypothetical protein